MLDEMFEFAEACVEAVIHEATSDRDTACILGVFILPALVPIYLAWAAWPRKKPLEYKP